MDIVNGGIYKHFKGGLYQVLCTASHSETGEKLVIYQALYGSFEIYARPLNEFLSQVDRNKYPDSPQLYRFQNIPKTSLTPEVSGNVSKTPSDPVQDSVSSHEDTPDISVIMQFLDADTSEEKLSVIRSNISKIDEKTINNIEASMDIVSDSTDPDTRIGYICDVLRTRARYESTRLR